MPTHRNQQDMTIPRSLRLIAVDVIETPFSHFRFQFSHSTSKHLQKGHCVWYLWAHRQPHE